MVLSRILDWPPVQAACLVPQLESLLAKRLADGSRLPQGGDGDPT